MTAKINKLQGIATFTRVAEEGGFTAAAARLDTSVSNVTKIISRLEDDLGARLFNRTTRSMALTECGELYYQRCIRIMADLEDAETMIRDATSTVEGRVRIAMPYPFGRDVLIPALPEFYRLYPSIALKMTFRGGDVDIVKEGFDLAVRVGELPDSGLIRRVLFKTPMVTVAAPSYLQKYGTPLTPTDLYGHNCIIGLRVGAEWRYRHNGELITVIIRGNLQLDNSEGLREATIAGLGISHSSSWLFRKQIESGSLVTILNNYDQEGLPLALLYSAKRHIPAKVKTVIDFLTELTRESSLPVMGEARPAAQKETAIRSSSDMRVGLQPENGVADGLSARGSKAGVQTGHQLRQMSIAAAKNSQPN